MITRITSIEELNRIMLETLLNKTSKVSSVAPNSVLSAMTFAMSRVAQAGLKDISIIESQFFPESAYGANLDAIALQRGVASRFASSQSSTYLRIIANPGTTYTAGTHQFSGSSGITFDLVSTFTVGTSGVTYAKVRSTDVGEKTNVDVGAISTVSPIPEGHTAAFNEFQATGGRDAESDDLFRERIINSVNILARGTLEYLLQCVLTVNTNILRLLYLGVTSTGAHKIGVVTQNGIDLTSTEIDALYAGMGAWVSVADLRRRYNSQYGVEFVNVPFFEIDVDFRVKLDDSFEVDQIRSDIQTTFSKYIDFRFWDWTKAVEWDDLLQIAKNVPGVIYVPDQQFYPQNDITLEYGTFPRFRGFVMRDIDGSVLVDNGGVISATYYPNEPSLNFQSTILNA